MLGHVNDLKISSHMQECAEMNLTLRLTRQKTRSVEAEISFQVKICEVF